MQPRWLARGLSVLGLLLAVTLPATVRAQGETATFFIAHPGAHAEATQDNPIQLAGVQPVSFEVRMRSAGAVEKAGWQTSLSIDACEFELPSASAIVLGDMFGAGIPVRQVLQVDEDVFQVKLGQVMFAGSITAADGLLATVTLTPKAQRSCPSGGAGVSTGQIRFSDPPGTQWSAPGGVKLAFQARPGHFTRVPGAVALAEAEAAAAGIGWPLLLAVATAVLVGLFALVRVLPRRSRSHDRTII